MTPEKLSGIPQTMLWTLYHRASESMRPDAILKDVAAERIYRQLDFNFLPIFGPPDPAVAARARMFDEVVGAWLAQHPDGTVVELGCGLETQSQRLDNGTVRWVFVDLPHSLAWRKRLVADHARCRHIGQDCFVLDWLGQIDATRGVIVTAQGLLMYFAQAQVQSLIGAIFRHFDEVDLVFDILPMWASLWTTSPLGCWKSPYFRTPPMPWGVAPSQIEALLQSWTEKTVQVRRQPIRMMRPYHSQWLRWLGSMPVLQDQLPAIVHAHAGPGRGPDGAAVSGRW